MVNEYPRAIEVEQALLGSIINQSEVLYQVVPILKTEDFFEHAHQVIWDALVALSQTKEKINLILLLQYLSDKKELLMVGGSDYLEVLMSKGYQHYLSLDYANAIKEKSVRRKLIEAAHKIESVAVDADDDHQALEAAQDVIFKISEQSDRKDLIPAKQIIQDVQKELTLRKQSDDSFLGVRTGFTNLDYKTNGLQRGNLILLAARPSMGKTSLGMNIVEEIALTGNHNICVFSLEMDAQMLMMRLISSVSFIPLEKVISGKLDTQGWEDVLMASEKLAKSNIAIDDTSGITVNEIRSKLRKYKMKNAKIDLVLIDYLQLMESSTSSENRQLEIAKISRGLKEIAKEMDCPLIALSQLSREPEKRANHRPMLSDLRESGAIEQDADLVMFLYRDHVYNPEANPSEAELIIAKQRNGETGTIKLTWMGQFTRFRNYADKQ